MKCSYFNKELDEDRKIGYICSCELGYFEAESQHSAIDQFCSGCEDKDTEGCSDDNEDEDED